ncbi:MAG: hypothetical protein H0T56_08135 [Pseudaminobacter sp.]|nr:hypothetical protein [Pseudaminobacter sp.]
MKIFAAEQKIAKTDTAARQIANAELAARVKKTARLRQLRLEKETTERLENPVDSNPPKRKARKAS